MVQSASNEDRADQPPQSETSAKLTIAEFEVLLRAAGVAVDRDQLPQLLRAYESTSRTIARLHEPSSRTDTSGADAFDAGWAPNRRHG